MANWEKAKYMAEDKGWVEPEFFKYVPDRFKEIVGVALIKKWILDSHHIIVFTSFDINPINIRIMGGIMKKEKIKKTTQTIEGYDNDIPLDQALIDSEITLIEKFLESDSI